MALRTVFTYASLPALAVACSAAGEPSPLVVGSEGRGPNGDSGGGGTVPIQPDGGGSNAFTAHIEHHGAPVTIVALCTNDCAEVEAVASGGYRPYTFVWEDGSTNPVRRLCPTA